MLRIGVIGLGDMGIGLARNLVSAGFPTTGFDLRPGRVDLLEAAGGTAAADCAEVGARSDAVFVMVLNGSQAREALLGPQGAATRMSPGSTVIVTATILPSEVKALDRPLAERGLHLIDTPVSGGKAGAEAGTLTLMTAGESAVLEKNREALAAISKEVFHVGDEIGQGQVVKAALQVLIGCTFAATFESLVLGVKAGVSGRTLFDVIRSSAVGSPLFEHCARQVLDRKFKNTGSRIATMYKDLGISMSVARESGAAMFATSAAYEIFQAGISRFPDEDNWAVAKWLEEIADTEVNW
jgi:3-hydroxyisobutyrate dehydrogenase-like beta-hydroxyacid dehydrogenase